MRGSNLRAAALVAGFLALSLLILGDGNFAGSGGATDVVSVGAAPADGATGAKTASTTTTTMMVVTAPASTGPARAGATSTTTATSAAATSESTLPASRTSAPASAVAAPDTTAPSSPSTTATTALVAEETTVTSTAPVATGGPLDATTCPSGTYVNTAGDEVCRPYMSDTPPAGATARCRDGEYSFSESRQGTCSGHGGVRDWL